MQLDMSMSTSHNLFTHKYNVLLHEVKSKKLILWLLILKWRATVVMPRLCLTLLLYFLTQVHYLMI